MFRNFAGRSSRCAFRSAGHPRRRSPQLLADAQASTTCTLQTHSDPRGVSHSRAVAVGGQLRASVWLHLWFPRGLRADAVHLVWPIRPTAQDPADLDVHAAGRGTVCPVAGAVLQHTGIRVRGVQAVHVHTVYAGLLRLAEHKFQARGASMTQGAAVPSRAPSTVWPPMSRSLHHSIALYNPIIFPGAF